MSGWHFLNFGFFVQKIAEIFFLEEPSRNGFGLKWSNLSNLIHFGKGRMGKVPLWQRLQKAFILCPNCGTHARIHQIPRWFPIQALTKSRHSELALPWMHSICIVFFFAIPCVGLDYPPGFPHLCIEGGSWEWGENTWSFLSNEFFIPLKHSVCLKIRPWVSSECLFGNQRVLLHAVACHVFCCAAVFWSFCFCSFIFKYKQAMPFFPLGKQLISHFWNWTHTSADVSRLVLTQGVVTEEAGFKACHFILLLKKFSLLKS